LPLSFNRSAFGPGVAFFFLEWFELFTAFFLLTHLGVRSLCKWVSVHQPLALCSLYRCYGSLTIVHLAIVAEEIELSEIPMQVFTADIVVDTDENTPY
jgi:hypothetical protein